MTARWLALAAALLFVVLVVRQLNRPLMYDDANFALAARAVADTGVPFGNQGWMSERGDFSQQDQWALWHPPLYVYLLGAFAKIAGWTPVVLRLPAVLSGLASAALTYLLARDLTHGPPQAKRLAGAVAATLLLVCPLTVQSTLILDIDFALLLPMTLLFIWLYLREQPLWQLALLFAGLLWAKMTNPLPLLVVIVVWQLLRGAPRQAALHLVAIGGGGAAIFGLTWLTLGTALRFPLDMPFGVNLVQWQDSSDVARRAFASIGAFVEGLQPTVLWIGPGVVALGLAGIALRAAQLVRGWRILKVDVLIGLLIVLVLGYVNKNAGWLPKYQVALVPLLACLGAPIVAHAWCLRPRLAIGVAAAIASVAAVVTARLVRDDWALQRTYAVEWSAAAWLLLAVAVPMLVGFRWRAAGVGATAALAGLATGWALVTAMYQSAAPYSTTYWYGTTGTGESAAWLDQNIGPDDTFVAAKEVAIRARNQRYVDQDNLIYFLSTGRGFDGIWAGQPVGTILVWQREPYVADLLAQRLPGYREVARIGDYAVYQPAN
ncbi:MAG TPA: glycosyltransferase family 39 protein [Chloroflexota bacterium]|nr:glycosyltransferase family 39 protein [Chloroflexota bacterium]